MSVKTKLKRAPRHCRIKSLAKIRNVQNYLPLLELIQNYHFINSAQIMALAAVSNLNTARKLQKLYHNGFVDRYRLPTTTYFSGTTCLIYTLERKGAELLTELQPEKFQAVFYPKRRRGVYFVEHALMIANFRASLTLALQKQRGGRLTVWRQGRELEEWLNSYQTKKGGILPDGYFVIQMARGDLHIFFEADRGTMSLKRFYEKIRRYRDFFRTNRSKLPPRFRVLTLAPSAKRAENLRTITIKGDPAKQGSERFCYCDEGDFTLATPDQLLGSILRIGLSGAEKKRGALLD